VKKSPENRLYYKNVSHFQATHLLMQITRHVITYQLFCSHRYINIKIPYAVNCLSGPAKIPHKNMECMTETKKTIKLKKYITGTQQSISTQYHVSIFTVNKNGLSPKKYLKAMQSCC
jgi:hypothetical protein